MHHDAFSYAFQLFTVIISRNIFPFGERGLRSFGRVKNSPLGRLHPALDARMQHWIQLGRSGGLNVKMCDDASCKLWGVNSTLHGGGPPTDSAALMWIPSYFPSTSTSCCPRHPRWWRRRWWSARHWAAWCCRVCCRVSTSSPSRRARCRSWRAASAVTGEVRSCSPADARAAANRPPT